MQEQLEEKEADFEELVVCLGAESAKVEALAEILEKQGMDVQAFLDEVRLLLHSNIQSSERHLGMS